MLNPRMNSDMNKRVLCSYFLIQHRLEFEEQFTF